MEKGKKDSVPVAALLEQLLHTTLGSSLEKVQHNFTFWSGISPRRKGLQNACLKKRWPKESLKNQAQVHAVVGRLALTMYHGEDPSSPRATLPELLL